MPAKKLSEYQSKWLWNYFNEIPAEFDYLSKDKQVLLPTLNDNLVVKLDDGSKRRMKRGLVKLNKSRNDVISWVNTKLNNKEHNDASFFVEKMQTGVQSSEDSEELYIMIRHFETIDTIFINEVGGISQHNPLENAHELMCSVNKPVSKENIRFSTSFVDTFGSKSYYNVFVTFICTLLRFFRAYHFTFLEVNPLLRREKQFIPLDFACLMDDTATYLLNQNEKNVIEMNYLKDTSYPIEEFIHTLDQKTGGSLKFKLLNPRGNIWTLIAGGGASVVYTDAICNLGYAYSLANYGEYSGNPPKELVYEYVNAIFNEMKQVDGSKILFIGGGIANFTDIKKTFSGIIQAMEEHIEMLQNTTIYVRRGGPNYKQGLELFKTLADTHNLTCHIHGPECEITQIVSDALENNITTDVTIPKNDFQNMMDDTLYKLSATQQFTFDFSSSDSFFIYSYQPVAIQRMIDFDYVCGKENPSISAIIDPRKKKDSFESFLWGSDTILIPLYNKLDYAITKHYTTYHVVNFASFRSAYQSTIDIMKYPTIKSISIIAEGIPEQYARKLIFYSKQTKTCILGPSTVGGIKPGLFRIGNTGGSVENINYCNLHKQGGTVAFVTRSGGLLNELCNIVNKTCDGVYQGMSIGGDRYPCSNFIDYVTMYQEDPNVSMIILLGEVGGMQEIYVANAVKSGQITKPVVGWCMGTAANYFTDNIQFGHAGASAHDNLETASFKNYFMEKCGIHVPSSFELLSTTIKNVFETLEKTEKYKTIRSKLQEEIQMANVTQRTLPDERTKIQMFSSISNEMGSELMYNNNPISSIVREKHSIGKTLGHLWLKTDIPDWMAGYLELILTITADHGAMVSGAHNTIIASRAGKDLVSSLCSGLLTIGDYFGGAINNAGRLFFHAQQSELPQDFVSRMNREKQLISGIGHKIKTKQNPDKRVELLLDYVKKHFPSYIFVKYGLAVEQITLQKRNNLILNVDGFIACSLLDCFNAIGYTKEDVSSIIENGLLNGFFVLGRTIGFIGHYYDQKRLKQGLYRVPSKDVKYIE